MRSTFPFDAATWNELTKKLSLPPQQTKIAELVLSGLKDKEIATEMKLGVPTVRTYLQRMYQTMGVRDRMELVLRITALSHSI